MYPETFVMKNLSTGMSATVLVLLLTVTNTAISRGPVDTNDAKDGKTTVQMNLPAFDLKLVYKADFSKPLNLIRENDLFACEKRIKTPDGFEWVLERNVSTYMRHLLVEISGRPKTTSIFLGNRV